MDPATGRVIDVHHPLAGQSMAGRILVMPGTRGSCTGSGVLLDMALNGHAPAALVFSEAEDVVTLGAMIAAEMFGKTLPSCACRPRPMRNWRRPHPPASTEPRSRPTA